MIKVKLLNTAPFWPLERQTPKRKGVWKNCQFFVNEEVEKYDYLVVMGDLVNVERIVCSPENTILITGEPESVKEYNKKFLSQFHAVITSQRRIKHHGAIYCQQAQPWMIGGSYIKETKTWKEKFTKDYDELSTMVVPEKTKLLSIVFSDKSMTKGHVKRKIFVEKLKQHFGESLDVFGVGFNEIEDKWDAIAPYKYYLAIENCSVRDYWTEKLSDAYLGFTFPFYYGCSNIEDYFHDDSMIKIDIDNADKAIAIIESAINSNEYENSLEKIEESRKKILNEYNLFELICNTVNGMEKSDAKEEFTIYPQKYFFKEDGYLKKKIKKMLNWNIELIKKIKRAPIRKTRGNR